MPISYGYGGTNIGTSHQNAKKVWSKALHEQVVNKLAFRGLIGREKTGEGSLENDVVNYPIVEVTQLGKESGDRVTLNLVASTIDKATWYNGGKSGNQQLVDNEDTLSLYNTKVLIAHQRFGVSVDGKSTVIRTPFDIINAAKNELSRKMADYLDGSVFFALYSGYSPNVYRELGTSAAPPSNHPNRIFGKAKSALTNVDATDVLDTEMLEFLRTFVQRENLAPSYVDGDPYFILFADPYNVRTLHRDSMWFDAQVQGTPRSTRNAVFENADGKWAGIVVKSTNRLSTAKDYSAITVTNGVIGNIPNATMGAGISATDVYMMVLLGANAVGRAFGLESYMAKAKEDDYENRFGFGGGYIFGDRRADFALSQNSGVDGAVKNQSSAIVYAHKGSGTFTLPSIW